MASAKFSIENLWRDVKRGLRHRTSMNSAALFKSIQEIWNNLPASNCHKLIGSLPKSECGCH